MNNLVNRRESNIPPPLLPDLTQERLAALRETLQQADIEQRLLLDHLALLDELQGSAAKAEEKASGPQEVLNSHDLFGILVKNLSHVAVLMFNVDLVYTGARGPLLKATGYRPEDFIGSTPYDVLSPAAQKELLPLYEKVLKGEVVAHTQTNKMGIFESTFVPIFGENREVKGGMLVVNDITAARQADMMLAHYKNIISSTPDGFSVVNHAYEYEIVNDAYLRRTGIERHEIEGRPVIEVVGQEMFENLVKPNLDRCMAGETIHYSDWFDFKNLGRRFISVTYFPYRDNEGEITGAIVNTHDNTELMLMEEELRQNERRLRFTLESTRVGTWDWNIQTNESSIDSRWADIVGYTLDELQPATVDTWASLTHPADLKVSMSLLNRHLAGELPFYDCEMRLKHKDGHWVWVWDRGMVMEWTPDGLPLRMFGTHMDITRVKNVEIELREVNATLERANKEVQQFAYIVSHDLRAPLINLKGFSDILDHTLSQIIELNDVVLPQLTAEQQAMWQAATQDKIPKALNFISRAVDRMDQYTSAILKLSRLGKHQLLPQEIETRRLVQQIIDSLGPQIHARNVNLEIDELPDVVTDRIALDQIFTNIITNAIKYLDPKRPGLVKIFADETPIKTIFYVADNGRGISEGDHHKIFAPFRRAGRPTEAGEGMGLAYVQALIYRLRGEISFESILEEGTTFTFSIPKQQENS